MGGTNYLTTGFQTLEGGALGIFDEVNVLIDKANPTVLTVINNLLVAVNSTIDVAIGSVDLTNLDTSVIPPLTSMCDGLKLSQVSINSIKASQTKIATDTTDLKTKSAALVTRK
jgi:DNA polymerase III delta prime subunit